MSGKKTIVWVISAGIITIAFCFGFIVYSAWQNPMAAFMKDALSSNDQTVSSIEAPPNQTKSGTNASDSGQAAAAETGQPSGEFDNANVINILLLGIDSNDSRESRNMGWRSDMVMLCTMNTKTNTIALTTIPRDTRTYVYHVDKDGNPTQKGLDKINAAYSYGGGPDKYGAQNAMRAVSDFLSGESGKKIPIQYYISTDLQNIPKLADAFGGVQVTLDVDFPDLGSKGDEVELNGKNVNLFLQNRHDVGGDIARARHHEEFIVSLMKEFKAKGGVKYVTALMGYALQYSKTNLNFQQEVALASILEKSDVGGLDYKAVGGESEYIDGISYYLPDAQDVKNRMNMIMQ